LNGTTGETISFQNTIKYLSGPWVGTELLYQSLDGGDSPCEIWVDGNKCRLCTDIICRSGFNGFHVFCDNLKDGYVFSRYAGSTGLNFLTYCVF
jgi:hypothetical protein